MHRQIGHVARRGAIAGLGVALAVLAAAAPAVGQGTNPWSPPGLTPPSVYASEIGQTYPGAGAIWSGGEAASLYAPPGLDAQLSGNAPVTAPLMQPQAMPVAPQAVAPGAVPGAVIAGVPGVAVYPGAMPYGAGVPAGAGYGYLPGAAGLPGYGTATQLPFGYAPNYGYGYGTGWPGYGTGYTPGWGGFGWPSTGLGTVWPGTGFSPFGFW